MLYTQGDINRADHLRKDPAALAALAAQPSSVFIPIHKGQVLCAEDDTKQPHLAPLTTQQNGTIIPSSEVFLGLTSTGAVFAQSVSHCTDSELQQLCDAAQHVNTQCHSPHFADLRVVGPLLPAVEGALLAYARGLVFWQDECQFCSRCGHVLHSIMGGHVKECDNSECRYQTFPRTDPAVIMLVTKKATADAPAQCLLGRNPNWPKGVYSTLAGFVESGESLEQAVIREVFEEVGITTSDVRYVASQPWPFPRSIMLGFESTAESFEINCDPDEIEEAQWFTHEQLLTFGSWGDSHYEYQLPRVDSIARLLVNRWIEQSA